MYIYTPLRPPPRRPSPSQVQVSKYMRYCSQQQPQTHGTLYTVGLIGFRVRVIRVKGEPLN